MVIQTIITIIIIYLLGVAHSTYGALFSSWYKKLLKRIFKEGQEQCER